MPALSTVFVSRAIPHPEVLDALRAAGHTVRQWEEDTPIPRDRLLASLADVDGMLAMVTERIDDDLLDAAPRLKVVANMAVGYDNVDVAACTRHGVVACNTPGTLAETTADLTWALLMAAARRIVEGVEYVREGRWTHWSPNLLLGSEVHHATLGIIGMGEIGWQVARRAFGFDMQVLYTSRSRRSDLEAQGPLRYVDLPTLLRESDYVSLHVALAPETRHLIGAAELRQMKPSAYLVNAARGAVVDQRALYEACRDGIIGGAALDVTDPEPIPAEDPILSLPNVVVVPHIGSATRATRARMAAMAAENILAALAGRRPPSPINPQVLDGPGRGGPSA